MKAVMEQPYPYNLPLFRRTHSAASPDGEQLAAIEEAYEISMSNPTVGRFKLNDDVEIDNCSPAFLWSDDSRYVVVPQWVFRWFRPRRERIIVIDSQERIAYLSKPRFINLIINGFDDGTIDIVDSVPWEPTEICIPISTVIGSYSRLQYSELK